jgi:hypothetical protein
MFNEFLYVKFKEEAIEAFVKEIKVSIKKLMDIGIDLPKEVLAYLILFKFPDTLQILKHQIMHSDKDVSVEFVCNYLIQFSNEIKAKIKDPTPTNQALLFSNKNKTRSKENKNSNTSKRCTTGRHLPRQGQNHTEENCWHVHPEKAPD